MRIEKAPLPPMLALRCEREELTAYLEHNAESNPHSVNMAVFERLSVVNRKLQKLQEAYYGKKDTPDTDR